MVSTPPSRFRTWPIALALVSLGSVYLTLVNLTISVQNQRQFDRTPVKKIVAYSLLKQIEKDSEEIECEFKYFKDNVTLGYDTEWYQVDGTNVFVYSVHKDLRLQPYQFVRIVSMTKGSINSSLFCQLYSKDGSVFVTKTTFTPVWSEKWDQNSTNVYYNPILLSCRIPIGLIPVFVKLTTQPCEINVNSRKYDLEPLNLPKRMFTVCVKPLNFKEDISKRLIQWIEINRILGAEKIELYIGKLDDRVKKTLKWYPNTIATKQFSEITNNEQNDTHPTYNEKSEAYVKNLWQKRRYEIIAYNDCFYRNLMSTYIIPLDVDEIIVPLKTRSWQSLLRSQSQLKGEFASFSVSNAYFFTKKQQFSKEQPYFFKNMYRSNPSKNGESCKSFIITNNTLTVFNHYAFDVLRPGVGKTHFLSRNLVQMNHYKTNCSTVILPECAKYISSPKKKDVSIFRYRQEFYKNYNEIVKLLKL
ncbi:unnamed protein product [Brassicogethes aeneus]|uniref:Glycosyltransferase family 92 protein n=1 Tax=Brassicogethes aeneus TaxID=1431903 RepID=A0A9P0BKH2_BRAAE|nr:unnamed protein product [Brassicogethes aeneus]